jgi:hypothetical protein
VATRRCWVSTTHAAPCVKERNQRTVRGRRAVREAGEPSRAVHPQTRPCREARCCYSTFCLHTTGHGASGTRCGESGDRTVRGRVICSNVAGMRTALSVKWKHVLDHLCTDSANDGCSIERWSQPLEAVRNMSAVLAKLAQSCRGSQMCSERGGPYCLMHGGRRACRSRGSRRATVASAATLSYRWAAPVTRGKN